MLDDIIAFLQGSMGTISTLLVCYVLWMVTKRKDEGAGARVSAAAKELASAAAKSKGKGGKSAASKPVKNSKLPYRDNWTLEQLAEYDGKTPGKPMLLSIKGSIFDVSGLLPGAYRIAAGRDASYMLAVQRPEARFANCSWAHLSASQKKALDKWEKDISGLIEPVGRLDVKTILPMNADVGDDDDSD